MGTVTIGADTFDVYGAITGLATRANGSLNYTASYTAATADTRARALRGATLLIQIMPFVDVANAVVSTAVADVVAAAYELALAAIANPKVLIQSSTEKNVKRVEADGSSVEFFGPAAGARFPPAVMALLADLLEGAAGSVVNAATYSSGVTESSAFDADDRYGLTC